MSRQRGGEEVHPGIVLSADEEAAGGTIYFYAPLVCASASSLTSSPILLTRGHIVYTVSGSRRR